MQLDRLRLQNFRQHADTTLQFGPGLTGIVGPNGAGKTTLLEAIAWAMYGTQAARGTRDTIRRRSAPARSRVEVELDFTLGARRYRIVRSLQSAVFYLDGEAAPIANSAGAVTDQVTRLFGMSRDEFFNTYFTGQKELAFMAAMTAADRARFLSRVLGYERLATVQIGLKEERSALRASLATAETGLIDRETLDQEEQAATVRIAGATRAVAEARAGLELAERLVAERRPVWEEWEKRRETVQAVETDLQIAEHQATEARRAFQELDRDLVEAMAAAAKRDELAPGLAEWDALAAQRDRLDAESLAFAGRRAVQAELKEVKSALANHDQRLARLPDVEQLAAARAKSAATAERVAAATVALEDLQAEWVREKQDAATKRASLLKQHDDLEKQLKRLREVGPTVVCPTCGKPLGKEYDKVLDDLETSLAEVMQEGRFYRHRLDQLTPEPAELSKARSTLEAATADGRADQAAVVRADAGIAERQRVAAERAAAEARAADLEAKLAEVPTSYDETTHKRVRDRLLALEPLRTQVARLAALAERAAALVPKAAEAEQNLSRLEAQVAALKERLVGLGWSAASYDAARDAFHEAERARQTGQVTQVRADGERKAAEEHRAAVARRRAERDARMAEIERLKGEVLFNTELDRAFTDLRDDLNAALRPDLSDAASILLRDLTAGRYSDLEITEDYEPSIVDDGEPKTVLSGGEEDIANLALRLAISQMIADRAGQPFSLLVLDEVFGSLDDERRSAVIDLLRSLADRFPQVILITHIESVRDSFDRAIRIDYDVERGIATAREETPRAGFDSHAAA
ncbi:MAG: SMC family ATPase [Gemmatimonadetes bacterium]|nr:SMC family ATPase [Gemmatimonadota bacterium]